MSHPAAPAATCPFTGAGAPADTNGTSEAASTPPSTSGIEAPVADWVSIPDLYADPFPIYRRMREESPVHWVPAVNRYMVTSYAACHEIEQDEARFSANEHNSLMKRAMGHSMLRKDNPEHQVDRDSYGTTLRREPSRSTGTRSSRPTTRSSSVSCWPRGRAPTSSGTTPPPTPGRTSGRSWASTTPPTRTCNAGASR